MTLVMQLFATVHLLSWFILLPVSGQLILHTKTQVTRHHRHHHSHHAPSPPEWVQVLQRPQQPLSMLRTDVAISSPKTQASEVSAPSAATKVPTVTIPMLDVRDSKILNPSPGTKNSDVMVSVSFTSVPRWPNNGEQMDFLAVQLGKWTRPGRTNKLRFLAYR